MSDNLRATKAQKLLYCTQCQLIFNKSARKPIQTDCGHTICMKCYNENSKNKNKEKKERFKCKLPDCKKTTKVDKKPVVQAMILDMLGEED